MTLWATLAGAWREVAGRLGDAPLRWPEGGAAWRRFFVAMACAVAVGVVAAVASAPVWLAWFMFAGLLYTACCFDAP